MSIDLPSWVDSHCHIDFSDFADEGIAAIVDRARLNRVEAMLLISTHTQRLSRYLDIAGRFPNIWTTIGVHPHQANEDVERDITTDKLVRLAQSGKKIVAIGECGLDYHYDYAPRDKQKDMFKIHIESAIQTGLPLIVHAREADDDVIAVLKECDAKPRGLTGVMHCFSSTKKLADYALDIGFYISCSGIVTFPKSTDLQDICRVIPLDRLLVETDAPYLAPTPYRGKRNEPAYVGHTGRFVAQLKGLQELDVARQTTQNFYDLFNKTRL